MGRQIGQTLANYFLAHSENLFMTQQHTFMLAQYSRNIYDIFSASNSLENVKMLLSFLSNLHPNLKSTYEIEPHKLAFLDTPISLSSDNDISLNINIYRKPTNTKTILKFHAVCYCIWKSGLIKCLLNRDFIACSNWSTFHEKISNLKDIFHMNGYPREIFTIM